MEERVAIVTGGLRGLGRAMAFGVAREGHHVLAIGHIDADISTIEAETAAAKPKGQLLPLVADLRRPADCDRIVGIAVSRFGGVHILVNNAGLTFTTIDKPASGEASRRSSGRCPTTSRARSSRPITSLPTKWRATWRL
jgi:NAD(P)-dependent dehydrogenase (short-subunit alcohol dehydrogenase family)